MIELQTQIETTWKKPVQKIDKLFGDASYRAYYRIFWSDKSTSILMALPVGKMSLAEEITNYHGEIREIPFLNIQKYLQHLGLPLPQVLKTNLERGWIFLEDLGDTRLGDLTEGANEAKLRVLYEQAINLLTEMQKKTAQAGTHRQDCIAFHRSFDATLLNWEFEHFWEYYVGVKLNIKNEKEHRTFQEETQKITEALLKAPQVLVHRDFQSRNLMWHKNRMVLIDFQDALMGPYVYDMVALLRDSYIELSLPLRTHLIHYYCEKMGYPTEDFIRFFHLQTLQRKLKDTGRFVYIDRVKKNPNFLPFIPRSIGYIKEALGELSEYKTLSEILQPLWIC